MMAYFFIQIVFKCDYDHYKVLSVVMTITVLLRLQWRIYAKWRPLAKFKCTHFSII